MRVSVTFFRAGAALFFPPEFEFFVETLSVAAPFGEHEALLTVRAPENLIALLNEALGAEATLELNGERWRGVVEEVEWCVDGVTVRRALDDVKTAIRVLYERRVAFGVTEPAQTPFDYRNADLYGVREEIHAATSPLTDEEALALRAALLAQHGEPHEEFELGGENGVGRLRCIGLLRSRCSQRYYSFGDGVLTLHDTRSGEEHLFGWSGTLAAGDWATTGNRRLHCASDALRSLPVGRWLRIAGHALLNGRRQIASSDARPSATYTGAAQFVAPDRILISDQAFLDACAKDDVVRVTGANAANNGFHRIEQVREGELRIKESYSGVQNQTASSVTITRCTYVEFTTGSPGGINIRDAAQALTLALDGAEIYQRFIAPNWRIRWVDLEIQSSIVHAPGPIAVRLVVDAGGAPGATLMQALAEPTASGAVRFDFGQLSNLTSGATYGLHFLLPSADAFSAYGVALHPRADAALPWALLWDGAGWNAYDAALPVRLIGAEDVMQALRRALETVGATVHVDGVSGQHVEIYVDAPTALVDYVEEMLQRFPSVRMWTHSADAAPRVVLSVGSARAGGFKLAGGRLRWPSGAAVEGWVDLQDVEVTDAAGERRMTVAHAEWRDGTWRLLSRKEVFRGVEQG